MRLLFKSYCLLLALSFLVCPSIASGQNILSSSFADYKDLRDGHYLIVHPAACGWDNWGARVYLGPITVTSSGDLEISFKYWPQVKFDNGMVAVDLARWKARRNVTVNVILEGREHGENFREELTFDAPISEVTYHSKDIFAEGLNGEVLEIKGKLCSDKFTSQRAYMYGEIKMNVEKDAQFILDFSTNDTQWIDKTGIFFEVSDNTRVMPPDKTEMYIKFND